MSVGEGNGTPSLGELGRNIADLKMQLVSNNSEVKAQIANLDAKVDRYANLGVDRRLGAIESVLSAGQSQRSSFSWQVAAILVAAMVGAVITALVTTGGK